jgi:hypothetical protein
MTIRQLHFSTVYSKSLLSFWLIDAEGGLTDCTQESIWFSQGKEYKILPCMGM